MCRLMTENLEFILGEIVDVVGSTNNKDEQFRLLREILEAEGIIEIIED